MKHVNDKKAKKLFSPKGRKDEKQKKDRHA